MMLSSDHIKDFAMEIKKLRPISGRKTAVIAVVGADGSGKSTLGNYILEQMQRDRPTRFCHLGKQTGNWGRFIARMPFVGRKVDRKILNKSAATRSDKGAGGVTAFVVFVLSMRRVMRFLKMRFFHKQGYTILTDRYPQAVIPGPMDGPSLVARNPDGKFVSILTRLEQKLYEWMATFKPDVVIRLNVDLQTAVARKPDHRYESLARKIKDVPLLTFNGAPIFDLDSSLPLSTVQQEAWLVVKHVLEMYPRYSEMRWI